MVTIPILCCAFRVSGASPTLPDCYDLDMELPLVPLPKPADLMTAIDADPDIALVCIPSPLNLAPITAMP